MEPPNSLFVQTYFVVLCISSRTIIKSLDADRMLPITLENFGGGLCSVQQWTSSWYDDDIFLGLNRVLL